MRTILPVLMNRMPRFVALLIVLLSIAPPVRAHESGAVHLAVLTFECNLPPDDSGAMIAEILAARLDTQPGVILVERNELHKLLQEQKLNLSGLIDASQAQHVGRLLKVDLLVTGRLTIVEDKQYIVCKAISVQTGQIKGFFITEPADVPLDEAVDRINNRLKQVLPTWIDELIPPRQARVDELADAKVEMATRRRPSVAVIVPEMQIGNAPADGKAIFDPAVETELKRMLLELGIEPTEIPAKVREMDRARFERILEDVASVSPDDPGSETRAIVSLAELFEGTDYLIFGQAFSADGGELHGLHVATARLELRIIDLRTRRTVLVERQSASAPDLSQARAGKTALQRAGRRAGLAALPKWIAMQPKLQK